MALLLLVIGPVYAQPLLWNLSCDRRSTKASKAKSHLALLSVRLNRSQIMFVLLLATRPMVEVEQTRCCVLPTCSGKQHKRGYKSSLCFIRGNLFALGLKFCAKQLVHPPKKRPIRAISKRYVLFDEWLVPSLVLLSATSRKDTMRIKIQKIAGLQINKFLIIPTSLNFALHKIGTYCLPDKTYRFASWSGQNPPLIQPVKNVSCTKSYNKRIRKMLLNIVPF